ncbi:MAG: phytanoyl-CoA dioxygenase family protein [Planctomycetota bacterium]|jgi:ectoine hydroxylase-related dioxygenase (phytanoyl-CoA dioxygenase family)|nr:phytanoyl-CoA dioxygenase family protein [Planctomycetota bacterium]
MVSDLDRYLFDLRGFVIVKGALSAPELANCNATIDAMLPVGVGEWRGHVHAHAFSGADAREGVNLQQVYEAGPAFERLIDHPAYIEHVAEFIGARNTFDAHHGELFIDENFVSLRGPGEAIGLHSGGHEGCIRCQYRYHNGFHCGQVNVLMALNDIGPGDGGTMVIPGSHKANLQHPDIGTFQMTAGGASVDGVPGAEEVHLEAGDALLFVDAIAHGSARRTNPGMRRVCIYRYGPSWGMLRHPYRPSAGLLERLSERQRGIVWPHAQRLAPELVSDMAPA